MPDVTDAPRTAANEDSATSSAGGEFIWYELVTPDPVGAKAFYDSVVGWNIEAQPSGEMDYRMIGRADGGMAGGVMRLTDEMASHGARPIWLGYINVDDVDSRVASIEKAGGKVLLPAFDIPDIGRIAMVADPQGAPFYVMRPIPPEGRENEKSDVFSPTAEQRVGWNELATRDQKAALDFYTSHFGWEKGDAMKMGDKGDYQFINQNGQMIGAIFPSSAGAFAEEPTHWRYYFRVANVDTAAEAVRSGGGTIVHGPMEVPGGDRILIGTDPQGAEFALVGK